MARDTGGMLQGTLGLLILKALVVQDQHGYGIAQWLQDVSGDVLQIEEGSLYPALRRLEDKGLITSHWAITESRDQLREETSVKTSYLRVRAYPFNDDVVKFIDAHERIYIVEQNRDAQLAMLLKLELSPERCAKLRSVLHYSGLPIDARSVSDDILAQEGFEVAKRLTPASASSMTGGE